MGIETYIEFILGRKLTDEELEIYKDEIRECASEDKYTLSSTIDGFQVMRYVHNLYDINTYYVVQCEMGDYK